MQATYLSGLGNYFSTESISGCLPPDQNSPQKPPRGLYAEQLSGSAFTAPRATNLTSWLYRIRPSVVHGPFTPLEKLSQKTFLPPDQLNPNQLRWNPYPEVTQSQTFLESIRTVCGTGSPLKQSGIQIHLYSFNQAMRQQYMMNADGEFLIIPQTGSLEVKTELGWLQVEPGEFLIIPKGIKFQINPLLADGAVRSGYIGENFGAPFKLPDLGLIGSNGLAHRRHFLTPVAAFEDLEGEFELVGKFGGTLWTAALSHCPLDVVAWHGNYVPYKYDLKKFNTLNTVSFDHPDPSIFTVLTSASDTSGIAQVDFVIFPPRWMVAEHTFRPPYFHRNCMSEYMGLIYGVYDAKTSGGFVPGGGSLHNFYSAHGPDSETYQKATDALLEPKKIEGTLAFMFESRAPYYVTEFATRKGFLQENYQDCWQGFKKNFKP